MAQDDENRGVFVADDKAYRKEIAGDFGFPCKRESDKDLKASPSLLKVLKEKRWIDDDRLG
jgi:hypothetical protein